MKKLLFLLFIIGLTGCVQTPSSNSSSIDFDDLFNSSTNVSNSTVTNSSDNTSTDSSIIISNSDSTDNKTSSSEDKVDDLLPGSGFGPLHKK